MNQPKSALKLKGSWAVKISVTPVAAHLSGFKLALIASAILGSICTLTAQVSSSKSSPEPFLAIISEGITDLSANGGGTHDCMLVLPSGQLHLERRGQHLTQPGGTLKIFEPTLDSLQLEQLRTILSDERLWTLSPEVQPAVPMDAPWVHGFNAQIARGNEVRRVGYWTWKGGSADGSPNSTAEDVKKLWRQSEVVLRPLVEWFHAFEASQTQESHAKSTMCEPENMNP